jgi:hypothetical protein
MNYRIITPLITPSGMTFPTGTLFWLVRPAGARVVYRWETPYGATGESLLEPFFNGHLINSFE